MSQFYVPGAGGGGASTTIRYLELNQNSTQSITSNTITPIQFPNSVANTFSGNLTISGAGNTTFTNASGANMYLVVSGSTIANNGTGGSSAAWVYLLLNRATLGNATTIFETANDGDFGPVFGISFSGPILLQSGDSFQIAIITNVNNVLGNSSNIQTTGQILRTSLTIAQIPGV